MERNDKLKIIHMGCGGEMVEVRYPPDPDGNEPVVGTHEIQYVCVVCGAKMTGNAAIMAKRMEKGLAAHTN